VTGSNNPKRYSPEFKDEAVKMVVDLSRPIAQVAEELGINRTTLGFWVKTYRQFHSGDELSMDMPDQAWNRPGQPDYITGQPAYIAGQPADRGDNVERAELTRRVSAALAGLDHDEREVIELHLRHDLDIADLAAVLGMPRNKVDALASRACGKLERALGALLIARMGRDACPALDSLLADWDGRLTTLTAPTRYLVTQHIERCEACEKGSRRALRAAVLSGIGPPAALPSGLREQVLNLGASRNLDAAAGRPDVVQRAASRSPDELAGATRFPGWWSRIRDNPGAATATGAIALWGMAALSAVLILVTGGRAVGDLAVHISNGPVATASAPASPSGGVSASAPARTSRAPSSPPSAGVPAPAAALAGTPTAPGSPAVPGPQASSSDSPEPSAFPSLSASSSPSQTPTPVPSSTPTPSPSPSLSPSSSPSPSPSLSLSPSPSPSPSSSTRTRRPRPSHSRSPSPGPSFSPSPPPGFLPSPFPSPL
jgi:transposase-like protein